MEGGYILSLAPLEDPSKCPSVACKSETAGWRLLCTQGSFRMPRSKSEETVLYCQSLLIRPPRRQSRFVRQSPPATKKRAADRLTRIMTQSDIIFLFSPLSERLESCQEETRNPHYTKFALEIVENLNHFWPELENSLLFSLVWRKFNYKS